MTRTARPCVETVAILRQIGVIPVIRCAAAEVAVRVTEVLIEAGLPIAEITFTVPNALDAITTVLRSQRAQGERRAVIGAGSVLDAAGARQAIDAGAEFIVSPGLVPEVVAVAKAAGVTTIPGALTPTEIVAAIRAGADLIKIFPVQSLGGAAYLRALRGPFPDLPLVPTGGVTLANVPDFIRAGAAAVGVGSELFAPDALASGDYDTIAARAGQYVAAVASARTGTTSCS